ncbi:hypothetical protein SPRG_17085 [Saprolegnia parasitica CBS 223.65]|uniref:F-box domain-containing protein n=1 Tax=Saprolegnia parasitica (strain CBS 223.65) TaxID=695850 RepID=A0A067BL95_SAPPC|nr:hypothetical protein SPRG_17085 [Saprolegnia parasitica CBS 223.65]KDO17505.1 hypothetical protein SPRG_17085 [Saprolegnia parasitica CBS 223.65]|eukprot:XP_012211787.1 hypothetical protein SPRG_17085 [Saprolegnia parasitica CBS 223.65]
MSPDVLIRLVQCMASPADVAAFLQVLPLHALPTPLAALRELLAAQGEQPSLWPQPCLDDGMDTVTMDLVLAAMPSFPTIRVSDLAAFQQHLATRSGPTMDLLGFAAQWGPKVVSVTLSSEELGGGTDMLGSVLRLCTGLDHVEVHPLDKPERIIRAITTPAHHVRRLDLFADDGDCFDVDDGVALLGPWLRSGHAIHLSLWRFESEDDDALAAALAATPTLQSLDFILADGIISSLASGPRLSRPWTRLRVRTSSIDGLHKLLHRLDLSVMTHLDLGVSEFGDSSCLAAVLPRMPRLEELSLVCISLADASAVKQATSPSSLRVVTLKIFEASSRTRLALLDWISTSVCLESVTWDFLSSSFCGREMRHVGRAFQRWIDAGVCSVRFTQADGIDLCMRELATALTVTTPRRPLRVELGDQRLQDVKALDGLFKAVAMHPDVAVSMPFGDGQGPKDHGAGLQELASQHGLELELKDNTLVVSSRIA